MTPSRTACAVWEITWLFNLGAVALVAANATAAAKEAVVITDAWQHVVLETAPNVVEVRSSFNVACYAISAFFGEGKIVSRRIGRRPLVIRAFDVNRAIVGPPTLLVAGVALRADLDVDPPCTNPRGRQLSAKSRTQVDPRLITRSDEDGHNS
jgi:hypothetical protein